MAGLIQNAMQPQGAAPAADPSQGMPSMQPDGASAGSTKELSPDALMAQMHVNPQQKQQLDRMVAAGMKVMFDAKTHQMMIDTLKADGPMPDKLGKGIAGLLGMLMSESKNSLPPELLVPAGIVLMAHAVDFLEQAGAQVTPQDFGSGIDVMVTTVLQAYGVDADKVAAIAGDAEASAGAKGDDEQTEAPGAPDEQE